MRSGKPKQAKLPKVVQPPPGFFSWLRMFARAKFGDYVDGRGRLASFTRRGSGRRQYAGNRHPPGTKLVRRFVRDAVGENQSYRSDYFARTGKTL